MAQKSKIVLLIFLVVNGCHSFGRGESTDFARYLSPAELFSLECLAYQSEKNETGKNALICQEAIKTAVRARDLDHRERIAVTCQRFADYAFSTAAECRAYMGAP